MRFSSASDIVILVCWQASGTKQDFHNSFMLKDIRDYSKCCRAHLSMPKILDGNYS